MNARYPVNEAKFLAIHFVAMGMRPKGSKLNKEAEDQLETPNSLEEITQGVNATLWQTGKKQGLILVRRTTAVAKQEHILITRRYGVIWKPEIGPAYPTLNSYLEKLSGR